MFRTKHVVERSLLLLLLYPGRASALLHVGAFSNSSSSSARMLTRCCAF